MVALCWNVARLDRELRPHHLNVLSVWIRQLLDVVALRVFLCQSVVGCLHGG